MAIEVQTRPGATGPGKPKITGPSTSLPGVGGAETLPAAGGDSTAAAIQGIRDAQASGSATGPSTSSPPAATPASEGAPQPAASPDEAQRVRVDTSTIKGRFNQAQATLGRNSTGIGDAGAAFNEAQEASEAQAASERNASVGVARAAGPVADKPLTTPEATGPNLVDMRSNPGVGTLTSDANSRLQSEEASLAATMENRFNAQSTDSQNSF